MKFGDDDTACASTRDAVARAILRRGPQSAADLAAGLGLSAAAIRRHLDALVAEGTLAEREPRVGTRRGRGRPARSYALTDTGRSALPHAYDDLAVTALRYLRDTGGEAAVQAFADHRARSLAAQVTASVDSVEEGEPVAARADALAHSLSAHGYASTTEVVGADGRGVQLCQHHCPVAHVAAEFPQLCEAETRAFGRVLGTRVQRLATIAHGDGVCTTHVPVDQTGDRTTPTEPPVPSGRTT